MLASLLGLPILKYFFQKIKKRYKDGWMKLLANKVHIQGMTVFILLADKVHEQEPQCK